MSKENKSIPVDELHKHPDEQSDEAKAFLKKDQEGYWADVTKDDKEDSKEVVKKDDEEKLPAKQSNSLKPRPENN